MLTLTIEPFNMDIFKIKSSLDISNLPCLLTCFGKLSQSTSCTGQHFSVQPPIHNTGTMDTMDFNNSVYWENSTSNKYCKCNMFFLPENNFQLI